MGAVYFIFRRQNETPGGLYRYTPRSRRFNLNRRESAKDAHAFGKLLPKEGNFSTCSTSMARTSREGARAFMQMIENYADPTAAPEVRRRG